MIRLSRGAWLMAAVLAACAYPAARAVFAKPSHNVLWVTAESLRPGHLGYAGYERPTSPHIDRFAETGVVFLQCVSAAGWTSESMVSNFTGLYSPAHGVVTRDRSVRPEWLLPLEILRQKGYRVPNLQDIHQDTTYAWLGFDDQRSEQDALAWLTVHRDRPFFVWLHLLDTHLPYDPPEALRRRFDTTAGSSGASDNPRVRLVREHSILDRDQVVFDAGDRAAIRDLYDAEIRSMDRRFGRLIRHLERLGLRERTLVIFSSDHGEELLERGHVGHLSTAGGGHLHDELLRVPLILSWPGRLPAGARVTEQVRSVDILPTCFDLLEVPRPGYLQGESLLPLIEGRSGAGRVAFASSSLAGYRETDPYRIGGTLYAVRTPGWKLLRDHASGGRTTDALYDLAEDPGETRDVSAREPARLGQMRALLAGWLERCRRVEVAREPVPFWERGMGLLFRPSEPDVSGVPSPPEVTHPAEDALVRYQDDDGRITLRWTGRRGVPYEVELSVGEGPYRFTSRIKTREPSARRRFTRDYWRDYVARYSPVRFRVRVDAPGHAWSPWRVIRLSSPGEGA